MTERNASQTITANIEVGVVILATTVSAVVWYRVIIWIWEALARRDWWNPPEDGAQAASAILALTVTWIIWGRVDYWLHRPEDLATGDNPSVTPTESRDGQP